MRGARCWKFYRHPAMSRSLRGVPPERAKSLDEKLKVLYAVDPAVEAKVDIGLRQSVNTNKRILKERLKMWKSNKNNYDLAEKSRSGTLKISCEDARREWLTSSAPIHIKELADHYGIFEDLYEHGYFHPIVPLTIFYEQDNDHLIQVHHGNILLPSEASQAPSVSYKSDEDTLWSLILTSLDGHLLENDKEYLHWFM